jgi:hypothetical protein
MKLFLGLACWFCTFAIFGQSPVTLKIDTHTHGYAVPGDFCGLSFETWAELPDHKGVSGYLFSPTNAELITLFTNSGIRNLRLGGGTVENGGHPAVPDLNDIDNVFGFARAADIKVIYSLRLLNGNATNDAAAAKYIWTHYRPYLECFSLGNEPNEPPYYKATNGAIKTYRAYLKAWRRFAKIITNAVPGAKFTGPDAGGFDWVVKFAKDEKRSGMVFLITQHQYAGGEPLVNHGHDPMPAAVEINRMLSRNWVTKNYPPFYEKTLHPVEVLGYADRMTEADDILVGVTNASNAFASALWALDYMHWWAAHGLAGVNFHNNQWLKTDTVYLNKSSREYKIYPKAYALRAFNLGSQGSEELIDVGNSNKLNLTAYAIGSATNLYVTIINKEHGTNEQAAAVTIDAKDFPWKTAEVMFLAAANGDAGATQGITLGGAPITNNAPWHGHWTALSPSSNGQCILTVPATSAAVVKLSSETNPSY